MILKTITTIGICAGMLLSADAMQEEFGQDDKPYRQFHQEGEKHIPTGLKEFIIEKIENRHLKEIQPQYPSLQVAHTVMNALQDLLKKPLPSQLNFLFVDFDVLFHEGPLSYLDNLHSRLWNKENKLLLQEYGFNNINQFKRWAKNTLKLNVPLFEDLNFANVESHGEEGIQEVLEKLHEKGYEIFGITWRGASKKCAERYQNYKKKCLMHAGINFSKLHKNDLKVEGFPYDHEYSFLTYNTTSAMPQKNITIGNTIKSFLMNLSRSGTTASLYEGPKTCSLNLISEANHLDFYGNEFEKKFPFFHFSSVIKNGYCVIADNWLRTYVMLDWYEDFLKEIKKAKNPHWISTAYAGHVAHKVLQEFLETFRQKPQLPSEDFYEGLSFGSDSDSDGECILF